MKSAALGNASLLMVLSAAIASACGSDTKTASADAGAVDAATAPADGGPNAADATSDANVADVLSSDACPPSLFPDGDGGCIAPTVRRPFLVGASMRSAHAVARGDWTGDDFSEVIVDPTTASRLARTWLKDALEEHASVAAFARFTMLLLSVGAPPELVARSQRASLDEIRHAELSFALSRRYGAPRQGPSALRVDDALGTMSLCDLAVLTAEEGCVGETLGAALAAEQVRVATDREVVNALTRIARDEMRHSELAWRFVRWAIVHGGDAVARAVATAIPRALASTLAMDIQSYDDVDLDAWHAHGRLTCLESRAIVERTIAEVIRPCLDALRAAPSTGTRPTSMLS